MDRVAAPRSPVPCDGMAGKAAARSALMWPMSKRPYGRPRDRSRYRRRARTRLPLQHGQSAPRRWPLLSARGRIHRRSLPPGRHAGRRCRPLAVPDAAGRPWHPDDSSHCNDNPRPFTWHKSAEEIPGRLAGYCRSLNNSPATAAPSTNSERSKLTGHSGRSRSRARRGEANPGPTEDGRARDLREWAGGPPLEALAIPAVGCPLVGHAQATHHRERRVVACVRKRVHDSQAPDQRTRDPSTRAHSVAYPCPRAADRCRCGLRRSLPSRFAMKQSQHRLPVFQPGRGTDGAQDGARDGARDGATVTRDVHSAQPRSPGSTLMPSETSRPHYDHARRPPSRCATSVRPDSRQIPRLNVTFAPPLSCHSCFSILCSIGCGYVMVSIERGEQHGS